MNSRVKDIEGAPIGTHVTLLRVNGDPHKAYRNAFVLLKTGEETWSEQLDGYQESTYRQDLFASELVESGEEFIWSLS